MGTHYVEVPGFPGLRASRDGRIESNARGDWRPVGFDRRGYVYVFHAGRQHAAHRLVALAFHGEPAGPLVRHLNGNPLDNRPENVAWGTHADNSDDAKRLGELKYGPEHHNWREVCKYGHPLAGDNVLFTSGRRRCRLCQRKAVADYQKRIRDKAGQVS